MLWPAGPVSCQPFLPSSASNIKNCKVVSPVAGRPSRTHRRHGRKRAPASESRGGLPASAARKDMPARPGKRRPRTPPDDSGHSPPGPSSSPFASLLRLSQPVPVSQLAQQELPQVGKMAPPPDELWLKKGDSTLTGSLEPHLGHSTSLSASYIPRNCSNFSPHRRHL